ncbi:hypothetical protein ABMA28_012670 [Loxostege sticticalis]|uniref:Reverse transcriptase domain-containing protein n=1 Tax=Loxostege sticticalis TaxID=481309 RepID=A0ABD0S4M5_LOXSC
MELLPPDTYTFVSTANGSLRWLDHCVVTSASKPVVTNVSVLYGVYVSDHLPLQIECDIRLVRPKIIQPASFNNSVIWGERDKKQIALYHEYCNSKLRLIDFPIECSNCAVGLCNDVDHYKLLDNMYRNIICILIEGAEHCFINNNRFKKHKYLPGWNRHVREAHCEARLHYQNWLLYDKPRSGLIYDNMYNSRKNFKVKLKYCQDNQQQIIMDRIAECHSRKQFNKFWKSTNRLNHKSGLPVSVAGEHGPAEIANAFQRHFVVEPPLVQTPRVGDAGAVAAGNPLIRFTAREVNNAIRRMVRGKSPGHDGLSIEHLRYAGVHLPRVLAMFYSLCISHSYLPEELTRTIVVPVIKNKTGDASDISNYRPISLATIVSKLLDSLLDKILADNIELYDNQFGFRPGLSTESAILCLKQTVQYYTNRKTPVLACFLDLSKAFDLVNYGMLWHKLCTETTVPREIVSIFRYWYSSQKNVVKWSGTHSNVYGLECGVRQGGLSSPRLFNLYVNQLIGELNSASVGCHIDSTCINNISYADDMVLLSPSVSAMRNLLSICESYALAHGLKYNTNKSEWILFKSGSLNYVQVPNITLGGAPLKRVQSFKYLGHWVTEDLRDNLDIERERRSLAVRCNMLARRFARCTRSVKLTLFKAYCQTFYTCSLWVNYTGRTYSDLRVQYNNALRVLLRLPAVHLACLRKRE